MQSVGLAQRSQYICRGFLECQAMVETQGHCVVVVESRWCGLLERTVGVTGDWKLADFHQRVVEIIYLRVCSLRRAHLSMVE
jgi:hypothetical protein